MNIGIMADTHDNLPKIQKAVEFFNSNKTDFVLHAGDYIAPFTIPALKMLKCAWLGVIGNNDGEKQGLWRLSEGKIKEGPLSIELAGRKIILVHDINTINPHKEQADCIFFGHTHKPEIKNLNEKLLVNPGECSGWLTGESTIASVDLVSLTAKIITI